GQAMAETEGFEPSRPLSGSAHLANECLQPLGHVSRAFGTVRDPAGQRGPGPIGPLSRPRDSRHGGRMSGSVAHAFGAPPSFLGVDASLTGRIWRERLAAGGLATALAMAQLHGLAYSLARVPACRGHVLNVSVVNITHPFRC